MKLKAIILAGCFGLFAGMVSCIDDQGNYEYRDAESLLPITISGLQDTSFVVLSEVRLVPEIRGIDDESRFEFTWYAYLLQASGSVPKRDTLSRTKELDFVMKYEAGVAYMLVFEIREKATDLFVNEKIRITGASAFSKGWFVVKDDGNKADMDFVSPEGVVNGDLIFKATGEKLDGKGIKVVYQKGRYYHQVVNPDGTVTTLINQKALHVVSERDMKTLNADNMGLYKNYEDVFYELPAKRGVQNIAIGTMAPDLFLVNGGKIHTISSMAGNVGKVGYEKTGDGDLAGDLVGFFRSNGTVLLFSRATKSFVYTDAWGPSLNRLLEPGSDAQVNVSPTEMNADLLWMRKRGEHNEYATAYALMKSVTGPEEYYLADIQYSGGGYPFVDFDTIDAGRGMLHAAVYGTNQIANCIYYATGNVLSYYVKNDSDAESFEKTNIYPFPAGETISFIEQVQAVPYSKDPFNDLVVLTNSSVGWKLYRFPLILTTPNFETANPVVYSGKGNARSVMYRE